MELLFFTRNGDSRADTYTGAATIAFFRDRIGHVFYLLFYFQLSQGFLLRLAGGRVPSELIPVTGSEFFHVYRPSFIGALRLGNLTQGAAADEVGSRFN